jgi:hypothetical protein
MVDIKREKFLAEYISNGGFAKEAAISVGISERYASTYAKRWLKTPEGMKKISAEKVKIFKALKVTQEDVIEQLWDICSNKSGMSEDSDRIKAASEIAKILGFLAPTKSEIDLKANVRTLSGVLVIPSNPAQGIAWKGALDDAIAIATKRKLLLENKMENEDG